MNYIIWAAPRTGSNLLCELLANTKIAGMRDVEHAHFFIGFGDGLQEVGIYPERVEEYLENNRSDNDIMGCKSSFEYFDHLHKHLTYGAVDNIIHRFDQHIYLTRGDKIAQAVSWFIAGREGLFSTWDKNKKPAHTVEYSYDRIAYLVGRIQAHEARFETYYDLYNIEPLRVTFKQVTQDKTNTLNRILAFLDIPIPDTFNLDTRLKRQVDPRKPEYIKRFEADYARLHDQSVADVADYITPRQ